MPNQEPRDRLRLDSKTMHKFLQGAIDSVSVAKHSNTIHFLAYLNMTVTSLVQPCDKVDLKVTNHMKHLPEDKFAGRDIAAM